MPNLIFKQSSLVNDCLNEPNRCYWDGWMDRTVNDKFMDINRYIKGMQEEEFKEVKNYIQKYLKNVKAMVVYDFDYIREKLKWKVKFSFSPDYDYEQYVNSLHAYVKEIKLAEEQIKKDLNLEDLLDENGWYKRIVLLGLCQDYKVCRHSGKRTNCVAWIISGL